MNLRISQRDLVKCYNDPLHIDWYEINSFSFYYSFITIFRILNLNECIDRHQQLVKLLNEQIY